MTSRPDYEVATLNEEDVADWLTKFGKPIQPFPVEGFWKPIEIDPARPRGRSGGTGMNSLHIDFVNAELPPDYVCFYCVRTDPNGGGANVVSRIAGIENELTYDSYVTLRHCSVTDGKIEHLTDVGGDVNPFYVLGTDGWKYRYTGRIKSDWVSIQRALDELREVLWHRAEVVALQPGQALVVDQRTTLHGRLPLHGDQRAVHPGNRRYLLSVYVRAE